MHQVHLDEVMSILDDWIEGHAERARVGDSEDADYAAAALIALENFQGYLRFHYGIGREKTKE